MLSDPFLSTKAWRRRRKEQSAAGVHAGAHFCSKQAGLHLPTSFSAAPEPKACLAQTLCPRGLCTQCGRAHSPSPCPQAERWPQPVSHGPLNQGTAHAGILQRWRLTRQGHGERSKACRPLSNTPPAPTLPGTTLNCPPPGGRATCSLQCSAMAHRPPGPHLRGPHPPSPGTFL